MVLRWPEWPIGTYRTCSLKLAQQWRPQTLPKFRLARLEWQQ